MLVNNHINFRPVNFQGKQKQNYNNEEIKAEIQKLEADLQHQLETPPKSRDITDWNYYNAYMDRLQNKIKELRKKCPIDKSNLDEVMMAKPSEFFAPLENDDTPYRKLCEQLRMLSDEDLEKISTFINWIT